MQRGNMNRSYNSKINALSRVSRQANPHNQSHTPTLARKNFYEVFYVHGFAFWLEPIRDLSTKYDNISLTVIL